MEFTTDSYIEMGHSHNICEDYALNGVINGEMPYIIVCDGCSSSKMTDFGARIMAHACKTALHERYRTIDSLIKLIGNIDEELEIHLRNEIYLRTKHIAMSTLENFGLPYNVCDATLLYAFIYKGMIYLNVYGDGNIIINRKNIEGIKHTNWFNLTYESNAPFYMSYNMDIIREKSYLQEEQFGGKKLIIDSYRSDSKNPGIDSYKTDPDVPFSLHMIVGDIESITLSSDGMESYSHAYNRLCMDPKPSKEEIQSLAPFNIMQRMVGYKNHNGEFVKRRMKRMKQEVEKIQGEHYDDVSSATIWIEHAE